MAPTAAWIRTPSLRFHSTVDGSGAVGQPGPVEGFVPIWGSGRAAVDDFQNGRWGWGSFNSVMAVSDIALVKSAITAFGKGAWKGGSHGWKATRAWLGRSGFAEKWQHVHHAIVTQAYFRGTRGGSDIQPDMESPRIGACARRDYGYMAQDD